MQAGVLFGILITIINKGRVSSTELSLKYEVSRRTILRYIDTLCAAQIPVISQRGRGGGFSLAYSFSLSRTYFTPEEFSRLSESVNSMSEIFGDSVSKSLSDKLKCMGSGDVAGHILASDTIFIDSGPWGDVLSYKNKMGALETSIKQRVEAEIIYHDADSRVSRRVIQPHTLVFKQGIWYVYAYCTLRCGFRLFKVGRIASIKLSANQFDKREIDIKGLPYNLNWFTNENNINVVLQISPKIRGEVGEWLSFENVVTHKNGKIYAFAKLPEYGLVSKLLSFGAGIKVIEPVSLRNNLLKTLSGITRLYQEV